MAYYIAVETEKNNYTGLAVKRSGFFGRAYSYKYETDPYATTLEEIDQYTMHFPNEKSLKGCLVSEYILPETVIDKPLSIIHFDGKEARKVTGPILYKETKSLVENIALVIEYITKKSSEADYVFFGKLETLTKTEPKSLSLVTSLISLIKRNREGENKNEETNTTVIELARALIYVSQDDGTPTEKVNYENLHNLVALINEYENSLVQDKTPHQKRAKENTPV